MKYEVLTGESPNVWKILRSTKFWTRTKWKLCDLGHM
jgi:hypothetical protein